MAVVDSRVPPRPFGERRELSPLSKLRSIHITQPVLFPVRKAAAPAGKEVAPEVERVRGRRAWACRLRLSLLSPPHGFSPYQLATGGAAKQGQPCASTKPTPTLVLDAGLGWLFRDHLLGGNEGAENAPFHLCGRGFPPPRFGRQAEP